MRRFLALAFCLLGALSPASPQESGPPATGVSIDGMVVKEPGSEPLRKVLLQLINEDPQQGASYTATSDSDGHFHFEDVQPGRYRLYPEKTGFAETNARGHRAGNTALSVQAGHPIPDLLVRMLATAVIAGRVVDEDGEPMPSVMVMVERQRPGKADAEAAGAERANDLGEYRFSGLFPGRYWIVVVPPPDPRDFEKEPANTPPAESKPDTRYLTTYYPGTYDRTQASAITIRAGDEMPVNFNLVPARAYRIRGLVTGIAASEKPMVQVISKGGRANINAADVAPDGQFEVRGVAPGSYTVAAFSGSGEQILSDRQTVRVVAADVEGVKLVPVRPFTLSGHIRFEGQPPASPTQITADLQPTEESTASGFFVPWGGLTAQPDRQGNLQWKNVNPGAYRVQVWGDTNPDTFVKSVTLGSANVETGFAVSGPGSLEVVLSSKGGMLEGVVLEKDQPVANAAVVAVPEEKYRKMRERFGVGVADQHGHFLVRGLAPGSYTVFAWQDVDPELYYEADFSKSQESNGTAIKVEEGSRQKLELRLAAVPDEWQ